MGMMLLLEVHLYGNYNSGHHVEVFAVGDLVIVGIPRECTISFYTNIVFYEAPAQQCSSEMLELGTELSFPTRRRRAYSIGSNLV